VYFELADVLLQRAASYAEQAQSEPYLREARDVIELFKVGELRDYFRDDCVDAARAKATHLETVSENTAVIYPILLTDRIELLVSLSAGIQRVSISVNVDTLTEEIRQFRYYVEKRSTREYLPHSQQLYHWLVRPLEPLLLGFAIETLVFVPDGPLRTIPMAALHDGKQFLIAKYAVATTPGLTLTDPRPLRREKILAFSAGLTEAVRGFPPLPNVSDELETVKSLYSGTSLLDQNFVVSNVERALKDQSFSIVHIASHGQFESDVKNSFVLAFDDKLTMDRLDQFVGLFRFRDEPLALLTLSACETAAGDDRAALGLAGVAIKAGARSALATLWFINDEASSALVSEFYRQLHDTSVSKAVALQRAQLKLLEHPIYRHPAYWAAFLLLNNWL
jgi:CHAT domain-containing protein